MTIVPLADRNPGEFPLEALSEGWANVKVTFARQDGRIEKRIEILHLSDHRRYLQEPMNMIAFKCFGLFLLVLPCYMLIYTLVHFIRLPVATLVNLSPTTFFKQIWKIARIPFYFTTLEFAALYGVFKPMEGRALFGEYESALHDGKDRRQSEQYQKVPLPNPVWRALASIDHQTSFFVAFCMQPIGTLNEPHILNWEVLPNLAQ